MINSKKDNHKAGGQGERESNFGILQNPWTRIDYSQKQVNHKEKLCLAHIRYSQKLSFLHR